MKLGIFGGTFNPPHMGHVEAARSAVRHLGLDKLLMMPANISYHKVQPEGSPTPRERLEMTRLACRMVPRAEVSDLELRRGGNTYTADTVRALAQAYPGDELWFIMGSDAFISFERWVQPEVIAGLCKIAVVAREHDGPDLTGLARRYARQLKLESTFVEHDVLEVSSTQLRQGQDYLQLPQEVARYIRENCLYVDFAALREQIAGKMSARRFAHVLGCEKMAAELAQQWGASVYKARMAALLHDMTKELPLEQQLILVEKWGIITHYSKENLPGLIHADTAAEAAMRDFGVGEDVADAIRYHSTGRENMSLLEKILYVADKCEETRDFSDVPPLRRLAFEDLDAAVIGVLEGCLALERRSGSTPDCRTQDALAYMKGMEQA